MESENRVLHLQSTQLAETLLDPPHLLNLDEVRTLNKLVQSIGGLKSLHLPIKTVPRSRSRWISLMFGSLWRSLCSRKIFVVFYIPLMANWAASEFYQHDSQLTALVACVEISINWSCVEEVSRILNMQFFLSCNRHMLQLKYTTYTNYY